MLNLTHITKYKCYSPGVFYTAVLFLSMILIALPCRAQQTLQDGKGEGTLFLDSGGMIQFNAADPSIRIGFIHDSSDSNWTFGINASSKLNGKIGTLIGENKVAPNAQFGFSIGTKYLFAKKFDPNKFTVTTVFLAGAQRVLRKNEVISKTTKLPSRQELKEILEAAGTKNKAALQGDIEAMSKENPTLLQYLNAIGTYCKEMKKADSFCEIHDKDLGEIFGLSEMKKYGNFDRLVFKGDYGFRQYTLYDPTAPFADQFSKQDFHAPKAQLIYTRQIGGNKLFGASIGVEKANNSDELTEVELTDITTIVSGNTTRQLTQTRKALQGDFEQYTRTFVNTDFAWFPGKLKSRFGVNFFTRSGLTGANKTFRPGIGLFISEQGAPTRVIGGISASVDQNGKFNVALTAGYNF